MHYDIALNEKPFDYGLTRSEVTDLYDMLGGGEVLPIEILAKDHECSAMGFITVDAADALDYEYEASGLFDFIADILDDMDKESEDCTYHFGEFTIWLTR